MYRIFTLYPSYTVNARWQNQTGKKGNKYPSYYTHNTNHLYEPTLNAMPKTKTAKTTRRHRHARLHIVSFGTDAHLSKGSRFPATKLTNGQNPIAQELKSDSAPPPEKSGYGAYAPNHASTLHTATRYTKQGTTLYPKRHLYDLPVIADLGQKV